MKTGDVYGGGQDSQYLKAADLAGRTATVTIRSVTPKKFDDGPKLLIAFERTDKVLVCNVTNARYLEVITGSDETDHWIGWTITLYVTKVSFNNRMVDSIRIDDRPGAAQPPRRTSPQQAFQPPPQQQSFAPPPPRPEHFTPQTPSSPFDQGMHEVPQAPPEDNIPF